ncbi:integrator complex subunit 9 isoform X3 [Cynara cardunculus var. scolymus]|uniref:integrator complex subunit 9 isoform X3 n=1 Tax=Cynara cardunculus var. scolymus TaxID=59895 RepID=UPI000D62B479|nr:integrator complex subunit 9 isoform X3 [Cynara cardunculus var. scolymus]
MKFTSLSRTGGYNLPPCHIVNLCGFHILFDCPLDLSALTIFSPISTSLYEKLYEETSAGPSFTSLDTPLVGPMQETKKLLDRTNLIPAEPYYKTVESLHLWNVSLIDVVLISSPMGMLGLPFLTRTEGFSAKIYATEATARLSQFMMEDLIAMHMEFKQFYGPEETSFLQLFKWEELEALPPALKEIVLGKDGTELGSWMPLYSAADVRDCLRKVQTLKYAEEACYNGTLIIKAFSSGLEIGSCNWTLKGPKRNISYISSSVFSSGVAMDFNFHALRGSDVLVYSDFASWNGVHGVGDENNCSSMVTDDCSTKSGNEYTWELSADSLLNFDESSEEMDKLNFICSCSMDSVKAGGSVLIPIGRLAIILQLLELFALHIDSSDVKVPIFIISTVAEELLAYTSILPEWLCKHRQEKLYSGKPVFAHEELIKEKKIHIFPTVHSHELLMMWQEPCIVVCPHWSLRLGPVVHLLQRWHGDPNSLLVLEEGVDTDLALLPFKPVAMKVLECSFLSGLKLEKVPPLLKLLQPKLILLPDHTKPCFAPLTESLPCLFYPENETLRLPNSHNLAELHIATDLASQLTWSKMKNDELTISRLTGELFVDKGKHYLLAKKPANPLEIRPLVHWGKLDLESLLLALEKSGVKGSIEKVSGDDGYGSNVLNVFEPGKALIQVKETSTVISTGDKSLASLISDAVHSLLDGI